MRFTKGKHAFVVATHIDKAHIHNHINFNSTSLDCSRKFLNFFLSGLAVQRISDRVCAEHGLSIIDPKPYRERQKRTTYPERKSQRDELCENIEQVLQSKPRNYAEFLEKMSVLGFEFKGGKHPAFRGKGQKRFIRLRSLGEEYSDEELRAAIAGTSGRKSRASVRHSPAPKQFNLLIDIQAKMSEGKTGGYERWAKKFNRKEAARTVCLLKEKGLDSYEELSALTDRLSSRFSELSENIKAAEKRMTEIKVLQTHINNYAHTRKDYEAYRKSGYSRKFFEEHRDTLTLHKAAKEAFNKLDGEKIPTRKALDEEFHRLLVEKKQAYAEYREVKKDMQEYLIAKQTVEHILGLDRQKQEEKKVQQEENLKR